MIGNHWIRRGVALLAAGGVCLLLAVGIGRAAPGEEGGRPARTVRKQHAGRMMAALERLNLSPEQKTKIHAIRMRQREEVRALRRSSGDRQALKGRMREMKTKYRAEIMGVLTREQQARLKAEVKKARAARKSAAAKT
jgi:Spy/CpxP family protein refolding chaperone